uniref:NADH-ubiquinone oxidoreductase chain 4 n=1 Tax=Mengenilla moldrzyki TaxID=1155016 RepID=J3RVY9_MENMO|nr:NADH dehydrogenase subunit 4 [Mengenilla moldrzyki]AFC35467.1 NADH dehydrogenase subunit 4 [Mengenilla moldrzyki]
MMKYMMFLLLLLLLFKNYWFIQFMVMMMMMMMIYSVKMNMYYELVGYSMSLDLLSMLLILLLLWIFSLMFMASKMIYEEKIFVIYFLKGNLVLLLFLLLTFSYLNIFYFYLLFESSMIIMLLLVMGFGSQYERMSASFYMLFYTLVTSLPLLLMIFYYLENYNMLMMNWWVNSNLYKYMVIFLMLSFLVKMPMYMLHYWLPKAHVEASVFGSMLLAGILLKLGGYGLIRIGKLLFLNYKILYQYMIIYGLLSSLLMSIICLCQIDMKVMIALSSVVHMNFMMSGYFTYFSLGIMGCFIIMISHGLCSSGLFCLVGIIYDRVKSRSLVLLKGVMNLVPVMAFLWFLLCISNMSAPPSLNLLGEIMLMNSILSWLFFMFMIMMLYFIISVIFSIYLFSIIQMGKVTYLLMKLDIYLQEFLLLVMHLLPLNMMIMLSFYY